MIKVARVNKPVTVLKDFVNITGLTPEEFEILLVGLTHGDNITLNSGYKKLHDKLRYDS